MEQNNEAAKSSALARGSRKSGQWLINHPIGAIQLLGLILLVVIVAQNLEPTSIDILFWTLVDIPKLLLLLISMVIGALVWELLKRTLLRRKPAA
ncbi:hypothetical protein Y5S_00095 [Alcanivorax nanhaiticus]|uniref:Lipopolysaccharide assembly protein A domain-containing protein n=1 Tax=Alcanivorax nanhaiticus TaxID=1177154 RepID=A0A095TVK5_9GAMM|nr:DUF1049 domain-containing protein [Alcanivorax nanhaiticus]KGD66428.1 hypothetical protein Y5S_00095 [Alcanivorax nanhaiticus]